MDEMSIATAFIIDAGKEEIPRIGSFQNLILEARELIVTGLPWIGNGSIAPRVKGPYVVAYMRYGNSLLSFKTDAYVSETENGLKWNIDDQGDLHILSYLAYEDVFGGMAIKFRSGNKYGNEERSFPSLFKMFKYIKRMYRIEDTRELCISPSSYWMQNYMVHFRNESGEETQNEDAIGFIQFYK